MSALVGLTGEEARRRLARYGSNALPKPRPETSWSRLLRQLRSPLIYLLLVALALDLGVWVAHGRAGVPVESVAIAAVLALNAVLGMWQEWKAEGALDRLKALAAPRAWVWRDGTLVRVPSPEIVPGDMVRLESGDRVPADGVARSVENASVDESMLTGESVPVSKAAGEELYSGTLVARGIVRLEVVRTGPASAMGRLAALVAEVRGERTPLERRLEVFGRRVAQIVLGLAVVLGVAGVWAEGWERIGEVSLLVVALAVAVVPEGLPAVLALTLSRGVERMARRRAVVRRLAAVEALGSVTVIATDKTGTLTENRLEVHQLDSTDPARALEAMVLASDADAATGAGDPLELALLRHAAAAGCDAAALRGTHPRRSTRTFDSASRFMRVTVGGERPTSFLKGAPEVLLERSRLDASERDRWRAKADVHAGAGYRVLALASGEGERESDLDWLGLVLLWDPPRPEVPDAIRRAREAGIRVVMITGDHPATALAVARAAGLEAERALTGRELEALSPPALRAAAGRTTVFARVNPEQKLRIVEALIAEDEVVAVTGDGVNDAPALKRAHVGVAMGLRGSDVSREAADLVLLDDNFATIVAAIEEGRNVYENIQKFLRFLFSTNLAEVLVVILGVTAAFFLDLREPDGRLLLPLTAAQLLWINLVTDGAPAIALGLDNNPGVMRQRPRNPAEPLLDSRSLRFVGVGAVITTAAGGALLWLLPALLGASVQATRTAVFLLLASAQLLYAYPARRSDVAPAPNHALHGAVAVGLALQGVLLILAPLRETFALAVPSVGALAIVAACALGAWGLAEVVGRSIWAPRRVSAPS